MQTVKLWITEKGNGEICIILCCLYNKSGVKIVENLKGEPAMKAKIMTCVVLASVFLEGLECFAQIVNTSKAPAFKNFIIGNFRLAWKQAKDVNVPIGNERNFLRVPVRAVDTEAARNIIYLNVDFKTSPEKYKKMLSFAILNADKNPLAEINDPSGFNYIAYREPIANPNSILVPPGAMVVFRTGKTYLALRPREISGDAMIYEWKFWPIPAGKK